MASPPLTFAPLGAVLSPRAVSGSALLSFSQKKIVEDKDVEFYEVKFLHEGKVIDVARYQPLEWEVMAHEVATMLDDGYEVRARLVIVDLG